MPPPTTLTSYWSKMGLCARLFLPLAFLIAGIVGVRYWLLSDAASSQERLRYTMESQHVAQALSRALPPLAAERNDTAIASLLQHAADVNPNIAEVRWQGGESPLRIQRDSAEQEFPAWFARVARLEPLSYSIPMVLPDGTTGTLQLWFSNTLPLNRVWTGLRQQAAITALNIFLIYALLGLLVFAARRVLGRVAAAARAFRGGDYHVRLSLRGSPEIRKLARTFNDMAERVQALVGTLQAEKERIAVTLESIGDAVITTDLTGRIETMNAAAMQLTGCGADEARGMELHTVFTLANNFGQHTLLKSMSAIYAGGPVVKAKNQSLRHRSGERYNVEYTAAPIRRSNGNVEGAVLVFRDVSETRHLMQQMSWQSHHDVLTGLPNRAALQARFDHEIGRAREEDLLLAVCLFDLDLFREVNESGGQMLGDEVLKQVASRLHDFAGTRHYVARLGGDEFVMLLREQANRAEIEHTLERLMLSLKRSYQCQTQTINLTASAGVAVYTGTTASPDNLLRHADQALYQAKVQGRSRVHFFDADLDEEVRTHHNRRTEIREALQSEQLCLYFQPKVNLRQGRIVGMEALLRWNHPERGLVPPLEFLPIIEHTDLIADIGEWVLRRALTQVAQWRAAGREWVVSVNIAARHFQRPDFVQRLRGILDEFPEVPPQLLELEILESSALHDVSHVRNIMQECQAFGIRFALDDFGTGYSSMSYLKRLPADMLKIDQSFVRNMLDDSDDLHLVSAVIGLARAFNRGVIAEGVETVEHGALLIRMGCDLAQGYGIARPMPADTVLDWAGGFTAVPAWENASLLGPLTSLHNVHRRDDAQMMLFTPV
ncbi:EAL domain-containing protein [Massilia endophytica]|uniref:EAL domain-containing protein n=1 Tax=Massilia endophytica TaxID=2899220 RepID=UPI001E562386|nr:EAL domain-containing protein [Massilia endophytica]UGQ47128.1 EAL domain-containing protein [Massilia endophytica]